MGTPFEEAGFTRDTVFQIPLAIQNYSFFVGYFEVIDENKVFAKLEHDDNSSIPLFTIFGDGVKYRNPDVISVYIDFNELIVYENINSSCTEESSQLDPEKVMDAIRQFSKGIR